MSKNIFANLGWLPQPPEDFNDRCKAILDRSAEHGPALRALASNSLGQNQLSRLARTIETLRDRQTDLKPLLPFRLAILSNFTIDLVVPALIASAARHGISLEVTSGGYDQALQEALSPNSAIYKAAPDAVLLAIDYRGFPIQGTTDKEKAREAIRASIHYLQIVRDGIKRNSKAICIFQTLSAPPETLFGSMDAVYAGSLRGTIDGINDGIAKLVEGTADVVVDTGHLAAVIGLGDWYSPAEWNMAKVPFSDAYVPIYAEHICRVIAAIRGKSRKCLVLDLDNTLWGGVIGDDGIEHIKIGQGDPSGEAYLSVQRFALDLRSRGIVLAVCSKNEDDIARSAFRAHPDMLLRENHIAVFQANWKDKPSNIRAIAEKLSLGLDSMVFLDDNPVERLHVRRELPEVAVPELPDDPALYARTLAAAGYFETIAFSEEDLRRADFYQDNARRADLHKQTGDLEGYLASLNMEITFQAFDETGRARIAQLINKSNQFNLTTKRYSEAQIAAMQKDPAYFTLQVRLSDIFGDNGMISVVICRRASRDIWEIDSWLMSCRVLGRRVENMVLRAILEQARREGIQKLIGSYIPTDRNRMVQDHYPKLGFRLIGSENNIATYELDISSADIESAPMAVTYIDPIPPRSKSAKSESGLHVNREEQMAETTEPKEVREPAAAESIQAQLLQIWRDLLDRDDVGTNDDFFEMGGDSLLGVRLMIEIEKKFHRRFDISTLVARPTIEGLARELSPTRAPAPAVRKNSKLESELMQIWKDLLDREEVGVGDDFFELGGDSLLGVRLMIEIEKKFHRRFDISTLVSHPTIESLASELAPFSAPGPQDRANSKVEAELMQIWEDLLDRKEIGVSDDFFELGGDSLLGVRLMIEIEKKFHRRFDISTLVSHPTIESLAPELAPPKSDPEAVHIVPMRPEGDSAPLFFIHCGTGHVLRYRGLASLLDRDIPLYGIHAPELKTESLPTIEDFARLYIEDIRKIRPHGPYQLFGFCFGGVVAYEIARLLTEMGESVGLVVLVESQNPAFYRNAPLARTLRYNLKYLYGRTSKYTRRLARGEWGEIREGLRDLVRWHKRKHEMSSSQSRLDAKDTSSSSRDIYDNITILATIADAFEPKPYNGRIRLIRAAQQPAETANDLTFGWQSVVKQGVDVLTLPGNHFSLLEKPDVAKVADALAGWLVKEEVNA